MSIPSGIAPKQDNTASEKPTRKLQAWQMLKRIRFSLDIPSEQYLRYYQGNARTVSVQAEDGRHVRFPAANLRAFVDRNGVRGRFEITLDKTNRLLEIRRV